MADRLALNGGSAVRTKLFPSWPVFGKEEEVALLDVLHSGKWGRHAGNKVAEFEAAFARYQGARYGIAVTNGTVSLRIALLAAGIEEGDEVIVPPYTFLATATAVIEANATPVFVDIHPDTYCMDPDRIEEAITPRTRAIIPVHLAGLSADMDRIMEIARKHNLTVIEDAAHAHGAEYKGKKVGAIGHMGSFSFQSSKNLTCGEGGIIVTNDQALAEKCRSLHDCGRVTGGVWYEHMQFGNNYRMTEFQGALLLSQFQKLEEQTRIRDANGLYLNERLSGIPGIRPLPRNAAGSRHAYHLYVFRYDPGVFGGVPRERFLRALQAEGIPASAGYVVPLCHQDLFLKKRFGPYAGRCRTRPDMDYASVRCPVCERACKVEACWLSQNVLLGTREDMDDILRAIGKVYECRKELSE